MKILLYLFILLTSLSAVTNASAETQRHFINVKYGQHTIEQTDQNLTYTTDTLVKTCFLFFCSESYTTKTADININKQSNDGLGIEYEWEINNGFMLSGEYLNFENRYTASNDPGNSGTIKTSRMNASIKKYFNRQGSFRPFIGIGLGQAKVEFTGPLAGELSGYFSVARAGFLYQFSRLGVLLEYQYIKGHGINADKYGPNLISDSYNMDGNTIFLGLRIGLF